LRIATEKIWQYDERRKGAFPLKTRTRAKILSGCPIDYALEIFGDRWSLLVLRDLLVRGKRHFREMMASDEGIASNILAARLKKLEAWGLVARAPDSANKRQIVYAATAMGRELIPVLVEIAIWSAKHDPHTKVNAPFIRRARKDRDALARETVADYMAQLAAAKR
jgi:DNA-binding HxlR family transcriptional regulator